MRSSAEIEAWALRIHAAVQATRYVEDARVELKRDWPSDPVRIARRLAGHANAARAEDILWLIGIDEKTGEVVSPAIDVPSQVAEVSKWFQGDPPRCEYVLVYSGGGHFFALCFDTGRFPYLVRNPKYAQKGEIVEFEVPWRERTLVRTARRQELLLLLAERAQLPDAEVMWALVDVESQAEPGTGNNCTVQFAAYLMPLTSDRVVFPFHKASISLQSSSGVEVTFPEVTLTPPTQSGQSLSRTIFATSREAIVEGPGELQLWARGRLGNPTALRGAQVVLTISAAALRAPRPLVLSAQLEHQNALVNDKNDRWSFGL